MVSWILGNHSGVWWPPKTCVLPLIVGVGWTNSWFPSCVLSNCPKRKGWPYIRTRVPYKGHIALYKAYIRLTYCPNQFSSCCLLKRRSKPRCDASAVKQMHTLLRIQVFHFKIIGIKDFRSSMVYRYFSRYMLQKYTEVTTSQPHPLKRSKSKSSYLGHSRKNPQFFANSSLLICRPFGRRRCSSAAKAPCHKVRRRSRRRGHWDFTMAPCHDGENSSDSLE